MSSHTYPRCCVYTTNIKVDGMLKQTTFRDTCCIVQRKKITMAAVVPRIPADKIPRITIVVAGISVMFYCYASEEKLRKRCADPTVAKTFSRVVGATIEDVTFVYVMSSHAVAAALLYLLQETRTPGRTQRNSRNLNPSPCCISTSNSALFCFFFEWNGGSNRSDTGWVAITRWRVRKYL